MIFSMITIIDVHAFCLCLTYRYNFYLICVCLIMDNDIVAYGIAIGSFDLRTRSVVVKNVLVSLKLSSYVLLVFLLVISFINNYLFGCFLSKHII